MSVLELTNSEHIERKTLFVDVILPLPLPKAYTYRVPFELNEDAKKGVRTVVQFGRKKILTGIISKVHETPPKAYEAKYILDILDLDPLINERQFSLFDWMSQYYMCNLGEVFNAALPAGLKLSSESRIQIHPEFEGDISDLNEKEQEVIEILTNNDSVTFTDLANLVSAKGIHNLVKGLVAKEAIILFEEIKDKYSPKRIKKVRLAPSFQENEALEQLLNQLDSKAKQQAVILKYLQQVPIHSNPALNEFGINKKDLMTADLSESSYKTLLKNDVLIEWEEIVSRFAGINTSEQPISALSEDQESVKNQIKGQFEDQNVVLFQGVTGSGKTEVYIHLIQEAIAKGKQVLYLLPEIALTTQIVVRLKKVFGNKLGIYHSRFSDNERVDTWKDLIKNDIQVIIGVRSSIFLPFQDLDLIVVDEEHDSSFKQYEPSPRYNARDTSIMLANYHQAKVLLGSATPSVESYHKALTGKWGLVKLMNRFGESQLPDILLAESQFGSNLTHELKEALNNALDKKKQAIIFQNRRGYSPYLICKDCQHIPYCPNCNVSLTYHMYITELRCHYCGHAQSQPTECDACGSTEIHSQGYGTEKIEEELAVVFPEAGIRRMDLDTTRKKYSYEQIITDFEQQRIDFLVGTQMVTKGLDFDHVEVVGVFDADRMIHFPDFRSHERAFQLMTQVAGRAGRKKDKGKVIIQTHDKKQDIFKYVIDHDFDTFFQKEVYERKKYLYPPYCRLIKVILKDLDQNVSQQLAFEVARALELKVGKKRIYGPTEPSINKIRNYFHMDVLIKIENNLKDVQGIKNIISETIKPFLTKKSFKKSRVVIDVDPY